MDAAPVTTQRSLTPQGEPTAERTLCQFGRRIVAPAGQDFAPRRGPMAPPNVNRIPTADARLGVFSRHNSGINFTPLPTATPCGLPRLSAARLLQSLVTGHGQRTKEDGVENAVHLQ